MPFTRLVHASPRCWESRLLRGHSFSLLPRLPFSQQNFLDRKCLASPTPEGNLLLETDSLGCINPPTPCLTPEQVCGSSHTPEFSCDQAEAGPQWNPRYFGLDFSPVLFCSPHPLPGFAWRSQESHFRLCFDRTRPKTYSCRFSHRFRRQVWECIPCRIPFLERF